MRQNIRLADKTNTKAFPNNQYRYATITTREDGTVVMERDFFGENPLHYYMRSASKEIIVASTIPMIGSEVEKRGEPFVWERVRAVSGNTRVTIDERSFLSAKPKEEEISATLQDYVLPFNFSPRNLELVGSTVRQLLVNSLEMRLSTIPEPQIGILLSGGLDSMSIGYLLSQYAAGRKITAFTLKVHEDDKDIVRSRELASAFDFDLVEVKLIPQEDRLDIVMQKYSPFRELLGEKTVAKNIALDSAITEALAIGSSPKKDNALCAVAMHLIAPAIKEEGIGTVFCGEGPNEMFNDYGFDPKEAGYGTSDKGDKAFREALTFGLKTTDLQMGRGGLAKHALARMGKIFAKENIRLESPYFDKDIAKLICSIPHTTSYDTIKQHVVAAMFKDEGLDEFITGTSKEKFQDGSGVSHMLKDYTQDRLLDMYEKIYGIKKTGYLGSTAP